MSTKTEIKSKTSRISPIRLSKKIRNKEDFPSFSLGVFRFMPEDFVNVRTGETDIKVEVWRISSAVNLSSIMISGRKKNLTETRDPRTGRRSFQYDIVYGSEALALALSGIYPCSTEEAKALIKQAKSTQLKHPFLCLESDLYPTDRETYAKMGLKNKWFVMKGYPCRDDIDKKLNVQLKKANSPLRIRSGLRTVLID